MKILFIYPNLFAQIGFNYGVAFLSAVLRRDGHTTGLLNINEQLGYCFDLKRILADVRAFAPDVIAFSLVTNQFQYAVAAAQEIRKHSGTPLVCGGIHPTVAAEAVLDTGLFDAVFIGESEYALRDYVRALERGGDLSGVPNICYRKNGVTIKNRVGPFIPLAELPPKDYEIFDFQKMVDAKNGWVGLMASRGCPFRCTYCFNHQIVELYENDLKVSEGRLGYVRHHPVKDVLDEIVFLQDRYKNIKMYIFDDDLFTFNKAYVREFCREYAKVSTKPFVVNAHVQVFDSAMALALKEAGCAIVKFGIESGSERVRREVMNRHMKNDMISRALAVAGEAGLHSSTFVMLGLPTETKEEVLETITLLAEAKPGRFRWSAFFPFPNTAAYDISLKGGFINREKMAQLSNFTDESCLDFGAEHNLWLSKVQKAFPWYVNAYSSLPCAAHYAQLIRELDALSEEEWREKAGLIRERDNAESRAQAEAGNLHYAIRFNPFMAVRSDWQEDD
ncbi:MAG: radical SAM protein [Pseudomonadota bacterium]